MALTEKEETQARGEGFEPIPAPGMGEPVGGTGKELAEKLMTIFKVYTLGEAVDTINEFCYDINDGEIYEMCVEGAVNELYEWAVKRLGGKI